MALASPSRSCSRAVYDPALVLLRHHLQSRVRLPQCKDREGRKESREVKLMYVG